MRQLDGIVIISTVEEPGMADYRLLLPTARKHAPGNTPLHLAALTGEIRRESLDFLQNNVDFVVPFGDLPTHTTFQPLARALAHPLGKVAKLFYALDFIEGHVSDDACVLFLDPDTVVQAPLGEFAQLADTPALFFGHELQNVHFAHLPNPRLMLAESFDNSPGWRGSYIAEINTGVILGKARVFKNVIRDFRDFVLASPYTAEVAPNISQNHWHDQDFFRYFIRKTMREDVAVLDLGHIYTTTQAAASCIYCDEDTGLYCTVWGVAPVIVHFAGGTREYAAAPYVTWDPELRMHEIRPLPGALVPRRNPLKKPPLSLRLLSKSPLDWLRIFRHYLSRISPRK